MNRNLLGVIISAIFIVLGGGGAQAKPHNSVEINTTQASKDLADYLQTQVYQDIQSANFLRDQLVSSTAKDRKLTIVTGNGRANGQYFIEDGKKYIFVFAKKTKNKDTAEEFKKVLFHEYGHYVFNLYLKNFSKAFNREYSKVLENKKSVALSSTLAPYSELFADTFGVILSKKPDGGAPSDKRDFSKISLDINTYQGDSKSSFSHATGRDPHTVLNPVRQYLWQNFFQYSLHDQNSLVFFAQKILEASVSMIDTEYAQHVLNSSDGDDLKFPSVPTMNRQLIYSFEMALYSPPHSTLLALRQDY